MLELFHHHDPHALIRTRARHILATLPDLPPTTDRRRLAIRHARATAIRLLARLEAGDDLDTTQALESLRSALNACEPPPAIYQQPPQIPGLDPQQLL